MRETGSFFPAVPALLFFWLSFMIPAAGAQDFSLDATLSEDRVFVGEQFTLRIELRGESLRNLELPELPGVSGLRILNSIPSRSQSISVVNGQTTTVTSYTFTLIAREAGRFTIPPVRVRVDGEVHETRPLEVEVLAQRSLMAEPEQRRPDIFTRIELDDERPYVGQQIIASLVIYFRTGVEVTSYQPGAGWRTDGFWKEQLENTEQPQAETVIMGDVRYRKATLLRYALFPSRPGELTLSPFELNVGIRTRPNRNDPFGSVFGGLGTNQRTVRLETESITLPVERLESPPDAENIGAVGRFEIDRKASVTRAGVGESIEITTTVNGSGNLPLVTKPVYTFPDHFEIYSPQEETDISRRGTTIRGTRTFRDRVVPRSAGNFTLPEKRIAVYDPAAGSFDVQTLPELSFEIVREAPAVLADADGEINLRLMTGGAIWQDARPHSLLSLPWVWAGLLLPFLALVLAWRQKRLMKRLQEDNDFARAHHAWDEVEELLIRAERQTGNVPPGDIYHLLHKSVTGYISARTGLPVAGFSDREICETVAERTNGTGLAAELKMILEKCSNISYAPVENTRDIEADIQKTRNLLKQLRRTL